ncbi:uncharacterized protein LOC103994729 isoform X3 [Musa acuminata AAA Group]|uniref:uncharacterized protein LOC103994729 isoform X3 n=1 Tax=Musa acuminata AAA Group TaxID=214697 RepID=UPI0031DCEE0A
MHEHVSENVKRFVPPPPRNRSINRRRPGDRYDKVNYAHGIDEEKSQEFYPRKVPLVEHGEAGQLLCIYWIIHQLMYLMNILGELQCKIHKSNSDVRSTTSDES